MSNKTIGIKFCGAVLFEKYIKYPTYINTRTSYLKIATSYIQLEYTETHTV